MMVNMDGVQSTLPPYITSTLTRPPLWLIRAHSLDRAKAACSSKPTTFSSYYREYSITHAQRRAPWSDPSRTSTNKQANDGHTGSSDEPVQRERFKTAPYLGTNDRRQPQAVLVHTQNQILDA